MTGKINNNNSSVNGKQQENNLHKKDNAASIKGRMSSRRVSLRPPTVSNFVNTGKMAQRNALNDRNITHAEPLEKLIQGSGKKFHSIKRLMEAIEKNEIPKNSPNAQAQLVDIFMKDFSHVLFSVRQGSVTGKNGLYTSITTSWWR